MKTLKNNIYMLKLLWKASPKRIFVGMLASILDYAVDTVLTLFLLRFIIDSLQMNRDFSQVVLFLIGFLVLMILDSAVYSWYYHKIVPETKVQIQQYLMKKIYNQAISVDLSCYENPKFYDNYTKANEEIFVRSEKIIQNLTWIAGMLFSAVATISAILIYEPLLLFVAILPVIVEQFFSKKYNYYKYTQNKETAYERRQMEYVKRIVYLQDYAKDLRLTNIFDPIMVNFHKAADSMRATSKIYGKKVALSRFARSFIVELIVYLATQGLVVYRYIYYSAYNLGALTTLLNAVSNLTRLQSSFSWAMGNFYENGMFTENFKIFLEYETKMPENENGHHVEKVENAISLKNVSFAYEGAKEPVLKNISMEIPVGHKIALVGHNGAGKSTFVKLLMRLYDVTEGEIQVDGINIKHYKLSSYRNLFGTIFQDFKIFATSIVENILLYPPKTKEDHDRAKEAVKASGIYPKIKGLDKGMNSQLTKEFDEKGVLMSGGEFQKLAIARVFAKDSAIAILDEPSSALDPISEYEVFENMLKACAGKTVIFVSHRLSSAIMADKIYMLENGEIIEEGSHQELIDKKGKYSEMFSMQAEQYKKEVLYEA
jgi:ATP-binding cassette subfamily B protein